MKRAAGWIGVAWACWAAAVAAGPPAILCTVFPVYQITRNVAEGREGVSIELMLPASLGCPHNYALTPPDMRKLARAEVLVINGLGLEEFLGAPLKQANPRLRIVDSSAGIHDLIAYDDHAGPGHAHVHGEECDQDHSTGFNPHLFASPQGSARLALNIAAGLSAADPEGAGVYFRNAAAYGERMKDLAGDMAAMAAQLRNRRIVQPHGVFDYLARDLGLEIVAVLQPHGLEPSAAGMLRLVRTIRETDAGAIFIEPQYPDKVGRTLARETGIPLAELDPVAAGPEEAPLDYFDQVMRRNLETIRHILGEP